MKVRGGEGPASPLRRAILTALLLRTGQAITVAEFTELLWDEPPASATANIRSHLTALRRDLDQIEPGLSRRVRTCRGSQSGYALDAAPEEFDVPMFMVSARHGRNLLLRGDADRALAALEKTVALWRGPFGPSLPPTRWFGAHVAGLNSARFDAYQDLFTAAVLADRTETLTYRIESAIAEAPYRQRFWELLSAVHCINGDAVGALDVIGRCQRLFADDLGLDLPPNVAAMRAAALNWDRQAALRLVTAQAQTQTQTQAA
ncbi:AfsR/SARP family transcriptional regulator [Streptomyces sp. ME19-01-6]|uniref:AfsR/SARP family transcriptional regulator n=1 Tax=Streptomyces sp. ME19-01-6 TaxID=3028686 RepID=UPI0029BDF90A|nr:BTAD domain-containing putative transcriptional regulator [Streptomyces sp. ME19-01-6]MDX3229894.1 BTAD domain-containing putative transcriptional regulator [Streptomyces sp. ME19-01-6]